MIVPEPTAAQAADVIAINHLAASYAEAVSRLQIEEAVDTYATDGVLASPTTEDAVGRAAIVDVISAATPGAGIRVPDGARRTRPRRRRSRIGEVPDHGVVAPEARWGDHAVPRALRGRRRTHSRGLALRPS